MLISDVDGVWTDGSFYKGPDSFELKKFSVFDGVGMAMARTADLRIALISGRYSPATESRAKELKIKKISIEIFNDAFLYLTEPPKK